MQPFPSLLPLQVALLRIEKQTHDVLTEDFDLVKRNDQRVFTIFDSFETARQYAHSLIKFNGKIVIVIYSAQQEVLFNSESHT